MTKLLLLFFALFLGVTTKAQTNPTSDQLLEKAAKLESLGKLNDAIAVHKDIAKKFPKLAPPAYSTIGGLYGKQQRFEEEIKWVKKAIELDPKFALAYINLGSGYLGNRDLENAETAFQKAKELAPTDPRSDYSMGLIYEVKEQPKKAEDSYKNAVKLDPKFTDAWVNLGALYANQKRFPDAKAALLKAKELEPDAPDIQRMLSRIERDSK